MPGSFKALPLVMIGGYAQTCPTVPATSYDFKIPGTPPTPCPTAYCSGPNSGFGVNASFPEVQESLLAGKATAGLPQSLITDVNAETNILIALICHADGKKPGSVCNRSVIKKLLKHVK